jgi:hypothetical protein
MNLAQFSQSGKWWFPGKYENKFNGKLEYNESEGGSLLATVWKNYLIFPSIKAILF